MVPHIYFTKALAVLAIASLAACATGPRRQTYWVNPRFGPEMLQHRFTLDSTECVALANQMIPEPPQPQTGNITLNTPSGLVSGSWSQGNQPPVGFLSGTQQADRTANRRNYAVACMADRGWQKRERIVGQ